MKVTDPRTLIGKRWVGLVELSITMFDISRIRPKSILGLVKAQKFSQCLTSGKCYLGRQETIVIEKFCLTIRNCGHHIVMGFPVLVKHHECYWYLIFKWAAVVWSHNNFPPSGEQPKQCLFTQLLQQATASFIAIFHKYCCCSKYGEL